MTLIEKLGFLDIHTHLFRDLVRKSHINWRQKHFSGDPVQKTLANDHVHLFLSYSNRPANVRHHL